MKRAAAIAAVTMLIACGGGGATKTKGTDTTTATTPTPDGPPPKPAPKREAVDVATLTAWEGNVDDGKVVVAAAEVDGETLRRALVPPAIEIITVRSDVLVTGRVAGSQVGALAGLVAAEPSLKLGPRVKLSGKGAAVELDFVGANVADLMRLFAESLATNVVTTAPPAKVTVSAKGSAQKLLEQVAKVAGLVVEKPAANLTVVRAEGQPKVGKLPAKGAKIDLHTHGARAGDVLGLIAAVTGGPAPKGACEAGVALDLQLRAVASGTAAKLVEKIGGGKVTACPLEPIGDDKPGGLAVVAIAASGTKKLAIAMSGERALLVSDGVDSLTVDGDGHPPAAPGASDALDEDARLAATLTGLGGGDAAIVELGDGRFRILRAGKDESLVKVGLGEIEVKDAAGTARTLKLEKRAK